MIRAHGARLLGPNCLGISSAAVRLNATFASRSAPPGNIGFSSQSGALGLALLEACESRGLGLSAFVSIGNKADVSSNDLLEWWENDPTTDVVLLYLESFGNPRRFGTLARRVARSKPILAVKSGTTGAGARAASSHTAALAGSEAAVDAVFRQAGVIRAGSLEELIDVAALLSTQPLPRGRRVAILTNAGGLGILCADACEAVGLELPGLGDETVRQLEAILPAEASVANPVDMLGSASDDSYRAVLPLLLADAAIDAVIALFVPAVSATAEAVADAIAEVGAAAGADTPLLAVVMSAEGIPAPLRAEASVQPSAIPSRPRALSAGPPSAPTGSDDHSAPFRRSATSTTRSLRRSWRTRSRRRGRRWLEPDEARKLLLAYGIPLVAEQLASSVDEAVAAARSLGFPVVVKTAAPGAHKTETGGIALELTDEGAVRSAAERIGTPVVVQPMITGGTELLAGLVQDPVFGPLVAFGPGGVLAELIGQASFRIAPLTDVDAEELVLDGKAGRLVRGFRGAPPSDVAALVDLVQRLSRLGLDIPEVAELDLNPVLGLQDGCVAVDARVRVARRVVNVSTKSW